MAGGGVSSLYDPLEIYAATQEEVEAAVEIANDYGTYVAIHAYHDGSYKRSLDAGVSMWEKATNWYTRATTIEIAILPGMQIPFGPAAAISSVTKFTDGVSQGAVTTDWYLANVWGSTEWRLTASGSWDIRSEYRASMTVAGSVPPDVKVAVFDLGNHLFTDREGVSPLTLNDVPLSLRTLIQNYQLGGL